MMAVDGGVGIHAEEDDEQVEEGAFLLGRAGVLRSEVMVEVIPHLSCNLETQNNQKWYDSVKNSRYFYIFFGF